MPKKATKEKEIIITYSSTNEKTIEEVIKNLISLHKNYNVKECYYGL